jgi:hypothetical protein
MKPSEKPSTLISHKLFAERLGLCGKSVSRLARKDPAFPRVVKVGMRRFYLEAQAETYVRTLVTRAAAETA